MKIYKAGIFISCILFLQNSMAQNVGIGTTVPLARLHITDSSVLFSATGDIPGVYGLPPQQGAGRRMMWYPGKAAFRAGYVNGAQWDKDNIGTYSVAMGFGTTANQGYSTALGFFSNASGVASTALGNQTTAKAFGALSIGSLNDFTDNPDPLSPASTDRIFQIGNGGGFFPGNAMTVLRSGNVGIGHTGPSEKLQVAGNAKADSFIYTSPRTSFYNLSGSDFRALRSTDTTFVPIIGQIFMNNSVPGKSIIGAVHLPHGAVIVKINFYIDDVNPSENLKAYFYRKTILINSFPESLGSVNSSGSAGIVAYEATADILFNVVDNSLYTYYVLVGVESASGIWCCANLNVRGVVIEYTLNAA